MRVLDTYKGEFVEIDPRDSNIKYAILSHAWDLQGEQTYQELREIQNQYPSQPQSPQRPPHDTHTPPHDAPTFSHDAPTPSQHQVGSTPWHRRSHTRDSPNQILWWTRFAEQVSTILPSFTRFHQNERPSLSDIWKDRRLSPKIREACRVARENGYHYLWIDSCCIDKTSSSELSESINSMYEWYARAHVCYAFLSEVPAEEDHMAKDSSFRRARWFTRGWTLQELIAPVDVQFLSMTWSPIGSRNDLAQLIVEITKIQYNALLHIERLDEFSVAQRFSWAANRETTKVEDHAYSLLGIFDITMPTLYGEGDRAFRRLQEEIMQRTPDQTLFAWTLYSGPPHPLCQLSDDLHTPDVDEGITDVELGDNSESIPFLVPSLAYFRRCTGTEALSHDEVARRLNLPPGNLPVTHYEFTPHGICMELPVIPLSHFYPPVRIDERKTEIPLSQWYLVILGCGHKNFPGYLLARICYIKSSGSSIEFLHSGCIDTVHDLLPVSLTILTRPRANGDLPHISFKKLYIPPPARYEAVVDLPAKQRTQHDTIKLVLPEKTPEGLSAQGYTVAALRRPDDAHPRTHLITLSHNTHTITIHCEHTLYHKHWTGKFTVGVTRTRTSRFPTPPSHWQPEDDKPAGALRRVDIDGDGTWPRYSWDRRDHDMSWARSSSSVDLHVQVPDIWESLVVRLLLTSATTNHYILGIQVLVT